MAKELTHEQIIKKQYSNLEKLNQRLKNISEAYYIATDGTVYVKSLVPFTEKFIHLACPENVEMFQKALIMPNEFFQFTKNAKKTHLTFFEGENKIVFGQDDKEDVNVTISLLSDDEESNRNTILPKMYKRFFSLNTPEFVPYEDRGTFIDLPEDSTERLLSACPIYYAWNGTELTFTKHLFLDIKKGDRLSISRNCYLPLENGSILVFYMIKQITELYDCYTLFNVLQSGKGL